MSAIFTHAAAIALSILITLVVVSNDQTKLIEAARTSDVDNKKLISMLKKYQKTEDQLLSFGWSQQKIDRFINDGCLPYLEIQ